MHNQRVSKRFARAVEVEDAHTVLGCAEERAAVIADGQGEDARIQHIVLKIPELRPGGGVVGFELVMIDQIKNVPLRIKDADSTTELVNNLKLAIQHASVGREGI